MSLSPSNILQRLQELRQWQESHDELLKKTKTLVNASGNITTASDYRSIDGLSAFDSTVSENEESPKPNQKWESVIISPTKSFNELLEEKLAEDPPPPTASDKPKKPFLRKGSGLKRFRLKNPPKLHPVTKKSYIDKSATKDNTPLRAPDISFKSRAPDISIKPRATWTTVSHLNNNVPPTEPPLINKPVKLGLKDREPGDQSLYERALEKELLMFEALEQRADSSSFCSTNSSVLRILSSTPSKQFKIHPPVPEEKRVHWESVSEEEEVIESNFEVSEILQRLKKIAESKMAEQSEEQSEEETTATESSDETSSISSADLDTTLTTKKRDVGIGTEEETSSICPSCNCNTEKAMIEYKKKMHEVLQEKNNMTHLRRKIEKEQEEFFKTRTEFEDKRKEFLYNMENDKKRLLKEKQAFQECMKESENRPNKKERLELSNMKQEIADLTETLKLKESKNGMTQARLRNQIKQLEKENINLKEEVEKLTKGNAKLLATQQLNRRPTENKILHEINKNITKLTKETFKSKKENKNEEASIEKCHKHQFIDDKTDSLFEMSQKRVSNPEVPTIERQMPRPVEKKEETLSDGSKQITYPNGNIKIISPEGNLITVKYYNGDIKEMNQILGTAKYYFHSEQIWQTTFKDGMELIEFPTGIKEKRYEDGKREVFLPDNIIQTTFPDGIQETTYADGSKVRITSEGDKILFLSNGQKEVISKDFKRREYPDGTVKILYPDGTQETRYKTGRVRIKDKSGILIVDTHSR